jgi:lipopolysaccharide/colanic/teichoic acid biosynthesis glycosyltransferase/glycosyltransferase involved in cell wall biosynthesis
MHWGRFKSALIVCHDLTVAGFAFGLAFLLRNGIDLSGDNMRTLQYGTPAFVLLAAAVFYAAGLHRRVWSYTSVADLTLIARASIWAVLLLLAVLFAFDRLLGIPRSIPAILWFILVVWLSGSRLAFRAIKQRSLPGQPSRGLPGDVPVLVYGCGPMASLFLRAVQLAPGAALRVVGIIDDVGDRCGRYLNNTLVLGHARDLERVLIDLAVQGVHPAKLIVTCPPGEVLEEAQAAMEFARLHHGLLIEYVPAVLGIQTSIPAPTKELLGQAAQGYFRFRRIVDLVVSATALVVLTPLFAVIAFAVLLDVGSPTMFRQIRPGRFMRPFTLYKFRTMRPAYDDKGVILLDRERTSVIGRLLRRTRLDELPQLYNVLVGNMSLIGPRPLLPRDLPEQIGERASVRPGLTGWAQVNGGHRLCAMDKLALDLWYIRNANLFLDGWILYRTLKAMLLGDKIHWLAIERAKLAGAAPLSVPRTLVDPCTAHARPQLLIVNRYFHPDCSATAQLLTDLVDALDVRGIPIRIFTSRQCYGDSKAFLPVRETYFSAEVHRLWASRFGRIALPGRVLDYCTFYCSTFVALLGSARRGDVLLAETDPPLISVIVWLVARLRGATLVNWCQDLFPETAAALRVPATTGIAGRILLRLRNASLNGAAMNVAVCDSMAERLQAEGILSERLTVIHNWADGDQIRPLAAHANPLRREWALSGKFVVGYSGNLGRVHDVQSIIELVGALDDEPETVMLFIGAGAGYRQLKDIVGDRRIAKTLFRPYQPRERLRESLTAPDLHIVSLRADCEGLVMPSKLYGILAAGRPVLSIGNPSGSVARIVRDYAAGLVAAPGHMDALAAEIRALRRDPARLEQMGANARWAYENKFSKEASLRAWIHHLIPRTQVQAHVRNQVRLHDHAHAEYP